ncbi:acylphosphatase [Phytoactinopolyspora halotolerans]|uniref:Acylphosphatase n=1 Tax=Phytoactinopolyspora halotolerans TaxID=1981512 RepID=A0A6L9SFQ1_9ACTN|nr:acylphosphatase [Phytoactinopolyspora halotolerans]
MVHGAVQGVFFRDNCRREAHRNGVNGWVRNRPDGAVEAVFEGTVDSVDTMISWARHGPPAAQVQRVEAHEEPVEGLAEFSVRHG